MTSSWLVQDHYMADTNKCGYPAWTNYLIPIFPTSLNPMHHSKPNLHGKSCLVAANVQTAIVHKIKSKFSPSCHWNRPIYQTRYHCTQKVWGQEMNFLLSCSKCMPPRKALFDGLTVLGNIRNVMSSKQFYCDELWVVGNPNCPQTYKFVTEFFFHCSLDRLLKKWAWLGFMVFSCVNRQLFMAVFPCYITMTS